MGLHNSSLAQSCLLWLYQELVTLANRFISRAKLSTRHCIIPEPRRRKRRRRRFRRRAATDDAVNDDDDDRVVNDGAQQQHRPQQQQQQPFEHAKD